MKMNGSFIVKLVFGILGAIYTVLGSVFLVIAMKAAGDIRRIFTLPEEALAFAINGVVFTVLGAAFLLVTIILLLADKRRKTRNEELLRFGTRVTGTIVDVKMDYTVRINHRSPLVAKVRCALPSGEVTLKSRRLWNACPSTGEQVEVIYDPMDEKKYLMLFEGE